MRKLTAAQVRRALPRVPGWRMQGREISRQFTFAGFPKAIAFVRKFAAHAEAVDHHPDIDIRWNKVTLALSTHSEGGLTSKDFASARFYSGLFGRGVR